jgi:hypothetical protein
MSFQVSDIADSFGSGGSNIVPGQGIPNLRDILRDLLARVAAPVANVAALQATEAEDRVDGQQVTTLDTYTTWVWRAADATAVDGTHIAPTDVGAGIGRWVAVATTPEAADTPATIGLSSGSGTLVNGVSVAIAANITASSKVVVTRNSFAASTAIGELVVGSRVNGSPGHFVLTSEKTDMSGVEVGDQSTFDWFVIG